ncbi:MAG: hypothetical protein IK130_12445 [Oscillospiraceae bacterium]|nr:hypothetical protein [Oscillospiraceae bacterium]
MVKVTVKGEEYSVKGTFDFGYIGLFQDEKISLYDLEESVLVPEEDRWGDEWEETARIFGIKGTSDEAVAEALINYINNLEAKVQKHIREINNNLIAKMAEQWQDCGTPFWEASDKLFLPEHMAEFEKIQETDDFDATISSIVCDYIERPNNGTEEKCDAEAEMRRIFPLFDWDKFLSNMKPLHAGPTYDGCLHFEISDGFGAHIFCCAVATLDEELRFLRWDNM